jgi:hypothetical protein
MMAANCATCGKEVDMTFQGECRACVIDHFDDPEDDFAEGPEFECTGFNDGSGFYCPLWGSEECDWDCPRSSPTPSPKDQPHG